MTRRDGGYLLFKREPVGCGYVECESVQILKEMRFLRCAGNRHNPRLFLQQPSERNLRGSHPPCTSELLEGIDYPCVSSDCFRLEAGKGLAVVVGGVENGVLVYAASEETSVQWTVRHEPDSKLAAVSATSSIGVAESKRCW